MHKFTVVAVPYPDSCFLLLGHASNRTSTKCDHLAGFDFAWPCNKSFPVTVTPHPQQQHRTLDRTRALIHHYVLISISDNHHDPISSSSSAFTDCVVPYLRTKAQDININNNNDDDDNNTTDGTPSPQAIQTKVVQAGRQKQQNTVQRNHDYTKNSGQDSLRL